MDALRFDVHPSVIFQLGEDLISDDVQALFELVKNCYDANATYAKIEISTTGTPEEVYANTFFGTARGYVVIQDDGCGMDLEGIEKGWLVVSNSIKRKMKSAGKVPESSRTPLGDKGLGRLGSQRLARNVEVITATSDERFERHVGFSWDAFANKETLREVPIHGPKNRVRQRKTVGTRVLLSGLNEPQRWKSSTVKSDLEERFAELISPFEEIKSFEVIINIDGTRIDTARIAKKVRNEADSSFTLSFDRASLHASGQFKLRMLQPDAESRARIFQERTRKDGGSALLEFLQRNLKERTLKIQRSKNKAWFVTFDQTIPLADIDKVELTDGTDIANPGPFHGEIDSFDLGRNVEHSAFSDVSQLKKIVRGLGAIRVYRDGFGIAVGSDFLNLGRAWTTGSSWYGLKPANTIGFISISARDNPNLVETTDREGFKRTPHYRNFELLLQRFVRFTAETLEFARRQTILFCDTFSEKKAHVESTAGPVELSNRIDEHLKETRKIREMLPELKRKMNTSREEVTKAVELAGKSVLEPAKQSADVRKSLERLRDSVGQAVHAIGAVESLLGEVPRIQASLSVLQTQIERFNERLAQMYETMGLGITAEALVHEISYIAAGLAARLAEITRYLKSSSSPDPKLQVFARHVEATIAALRKQLGHLDPALRYVREQRESINLPRFLSEMQEYHQSRWRSGDLSIELVLLSDSEFDLSLNRGKLTQIVDNLIINSEYWLREDLRRGTIKKGVVRIELQSPFVWVSDNGRGIDPSVEGTLFEPFVTTRKKGRGLGLFIVSEFLKADGASISLYQERNAFGRFYAFQIDFAGVLVDGDDF
jgi:signal transduction histidine kinase